MSKILVADDNADLTQIWKETLEDAGHTVSVAHTGAQAVSRLLESGDFDLLITDVNMPTGGGIAATSQARAGKRKIPVIAVSGNPSILSSGMLGHMSKLGADQILTKPVELDMLVEVAEKTIENGPRFQLMDLIGDLFDSGQKIVRGH